MWRADSKTVAKRFIAALSDKTPDRACDMLAEDVTYTDSLGYRIEGQRECCKALRQFFAMDLDFRIEPETISVRGNDVYVQGNCFSNEPRLNAACLWKITVRKGRIVAYQSFRDKSPPAFAKVLSDAVAV